MFLNDYCKEAINLTDFVENVKLNISDLLKTKELGYAGGISNIIIKNLSRVSVVLSMGLRCRICVDLSIKDQTGRSDAVFISGSADVFSAFSAL